MNKKRSKNNSRDQRRSRDAKWVRPSSGHNDPITWPEKLQVSVMS